MAGGLVKTSFSRSRRQITMNEHLIGSKEMKGRRKRTVVRGKWEQRELFCLRWEKPWYTVKSNW